MNANQQFAVNLDKAEINVALNGASVKLTLINYQQCTAFQQQYTSKNLPPCSHQAYKDINSFYQFLDQSRKKMYWIINEPSTVVLKYNEEVYVQMGLKKVTDQQMLGLMVVKYAQLRPAGHSQNQLGEEVKRVRESHEMQHKQIATKLKGIGQLIQNLSKQNEKGKDQLNTIKIEGKQMKNRLESTRKQLSTKVMEAENRLNQYTSNAVSELEHRTNEMAKLLKSDIEITQKTMNRNMLTIKEQFQIFNIKTQEQIQHIWKDINDLNFPRIKKDIAQINHAFDHQIRVKYYNFVPDPQSLKSHKAVYFLNKKTLKNQEDIRDYNKIVAEAPIPPGRHKFRITVKNIKNNGLMFGICTNRLKTINNLPFNDISIISLNSCGYLVNRGIMTMTNSNIKSGDVIKMLVDRSAGEVRWSVNDIEVCLAEIGNLLKQDLFPMIGLGYFNDEVEIMDSEQIKQLQVSNQSYKIQLARINQRRSNKQFT